MTVPMIPLRRVARCVNGGTPTADVGNWNGDVPWATPIDLARVNGGLLTVTDRTLTKTGLRGGSAVIGGGALILSTRAPIGYVARVVVETAFNQGCRGLEPRPALDARYLQHWLWSQTDRLQALGTGSTFQELSTDALQRFPVPLQTLEAQRRIADFLDDQVSRIDQVVALRRKDASTLNHRGNSMFEEALGRYGFQFPRSLDPDWATVPTPHGWLVVRLSQVISQLTNGFVGPTRDILVDDGIPYVQSMHIKGGLIDFQRRPFYVTSSWHRQRPRIHLRAGDVLIVQTGDIGQVAVVPKDFGEASCHALQIARVKVKMLSGEYLGGYLRTKFGYHSLLCRATGALHPHLEGSIRSVPIVVPPVPLQTAVLREVRRDQAPLVSLQGQVQRQVELLQERKRALITAAVTGEFDVTTATGRGVA
jgi:type I restriction enzyme S subunit